MKKQICVFIASPGDLSVERNRFREIIAELNTGFGDGANVEFIPLGWEDTLASTGRRNQSVINEEIDRADVFILVMYRRWGQPAPDAGPYSSYTEEEFYRALGRWQKEGAPEIFVFFKKVDGASEADPGVQLKKVMDFRKQLEDTRQVLYHYFEDEHSFAYQISRHLRAYAKGELPKTDSVREVFVLPSHVLDEVKKAKEAVLQQAADAKAARDASNEAYLKLNAMQLQMAQDAAALSLEGKIEYARQKFSVLVSETSDVHILSLGYEFFRRTGELEAALSVCEKMLSIVGGDSISISAVEIYINLGNLYQIRGEWARAEKMYRKAAGIAEALDDTIAMSWCLTPLGILFHAQGQVGDAEETFEKALNIANGLKDNAGIAISCGNLGIIYRNRREYERAAVMFERSLAIARELSDKELEASSYVNLATLFNEKGDLAQAEKMYKKALFLNEKLGNKEGIATVYGNLAVLYVELGKFDRAEKTYKKSLAIEKELGRKEGMASDYNNLGNFYLKMERHDKAEEAYLAALELNEEIGATERLANNSFNLAILYGATGALVRAEAMLKKARIHFSEVSSPKINEVDRLICQLQQSKQDPLTESVVDSQSNTSTRQP